MSTERVRLSGTSYAVLRLIELLGEATPYDLKQALEQSIENFWSVPHTTSYAEPERLAKAGLLSVTQEQRGRRRKHYSLTDAGREALHRWRDSPEVAPPELREEGVLKIFAGADPLPILAARCEWHRAKLAELEGYLELTADEEQWNGVRNSLIAGVTYHRKLLEAIEPYVEDDDPQAATGSS